VRQNLAMASSDPTSGGDGERDVFGSLPNARPQRRSAKRDRAAATAKAAKPQAAKGRPPATAKAGSAATPRATAAKPRATAAKPRAAGAKPRATHAAKGRPATAPSQIPPAGYATPRPDDDGVPRGAHLVTTAVMAAGELAQIGLAAGGRALKSALGRLPRP
jgi:hypothetical protein